jgi:hypothetical protein
MNPQRLLATARRYRLQRFAITFHGEVLGYFTPLEHAGAIAPRATAANVKFSDAANQLPDDAARRAFLARYEPDDDDDMPPEDDGNLADEIDALLNGS